MCAYLELTFESDCGGATQSASLSGSTLSSSRDTTRVGGKKGRMEVEFLVLFCFHLHASARKTESSRSRLAARRWQKNNSSRECARDDYSTSTTSLITTQRTNAGPPMLRGFRSFDHHSPANKTSERGKGKVKESIGRARARTKLAVETRRG